MLIPRSNKEGPDLTTWFDSPFTMKFKGVSGCQRDKASKSLLTRLVRGRQNIDIQCYCVHSWKLRLMNIHITAMTQLGGHGIYILFYEQGEKNLL